VAVVASEITVSDCRAGRASEYEYRGGSIGRWKVVGVKGRGGMPDGGWRRFVARRAWYGSRNDVSGLFGPNSSERLKVELWLRKEGIYLR
jgi:hypothetical protein